MSDARAATDAELMASLRDFVGRYRSSGNEPANVMRVMTLLNRLLDDNASDAARIRELEAALTRVATEPDVSCLAGNPMLWPSTIARDALGLPVPGAAPRP